MSLDRSLGAITPHVNMGWQHAFNTFRPGQVETIASLSQSFTVLGAPLSRKDAAAVRAGLDVVIAPEGPPCRWTMTAASQAASRTMRCAAALMWRF